MGGKTKQTQRTKNNAKPSSSSRSAELLGTTYPAFVGFSAHSDLGLVPFAPGFASAENMPETFDASISPQFQLIMRKLSKKDPMTKKKALQEYNDLVEESNLETIKFILPLWPRYYQNLATDTEHNVRELSQQALQLLVTKAKKAVAPYLKQLLPIWLASHFDNYAPAASIAKICFRETFAAKRLQEVCLHCQMEIMEYASKNLTFHTAATLSSGKGLTPEEADQKYHRVVMCSLKSLSFLLEHTAQAEDLSQIQAGLTSLLAQQKFWSFGKHKICTIKAAWFEFMYQILQSSSLVTVMEPHKTQLTTLSFQNIDESDPLVAPHVWACILMLQTLYPDWYNTINLKKSVLPKLSNLLSNGFNNNAQAICPNVLPFFSKLTQNSLQDLPLNEFYLQFFDNLKSAICSQKVVSKADASSIIKTYFECLRYLLQKLKNNTPLNSDNEVLVSTILNQHLLEPISWFLTSESPWFKHFFLQTSALVAFWADKQNASDPNCLYLKLLNDFWKQIFNFITINEINSKFLEHLIQLVNDLYVATPSLDDQKVKFQVSHEDEEDTCNKSSAAILLDGDQPDSGSTNKSKNNGFVLFIHKELSHLVIKLVRLCLDNLKNPTNSNYIHHVRQLTKLFPSSDFYAQLNSNGIEGTLEELIDLMDVLYGEDCDVLIDITFEVLQELEKDKRFIYITKMTKIPKIEVQTSILQRLLSYPFCIEPQVRDALSKPEISDIIETSALQVVNEHAKQNLNILHKCFFQTDSGEILISSKTVDTLLTILSEPLQSSDSSEMIESCGSFIAQNMPVVCSSGNSSLEVRQKLFLVLFSFSIERSVNDYISEDTLWEITTCWQDALSSTDITIDSQLLEKCAHIVEQQSINSKLDTQMIDNMAEAMSKFVTCSTENIDNEVEKYEKIDETLKALLTSQVYTGNQIQMLEEFCLFLESIKAQVTVTADFANYEDHQPNTQKIIERTLLNFNTILKLICKVNVKHRKPIGYDDENTEDYCDPNENILKHCSEHLLQEIIKCLRIASVGDGLLGILPKMDSTLESLIIELSEKVKYFMNNTSDTVGIIKERLLHQAQNGFDTTACRVLLYLVHCEQYAQFEESATILLAEDLSENFVITHKQLHTYVNCLQYLLPKLEQKSISLQSAIMRTEPPQKWIKAVVFRCLIINNFDSECNDKSDKNIITSALQFLTRVSEEQHSQKDLLLYNVEIHKQDYNKVLDTVEFINLLEELVRRFPYELSIKNWDAIRIGLSSWVLSVSKSIENHNCRKVITFSTSVYRLFSAMVSFVTSEKQKSSTELLKNVVDEWESLFSREVHIVLFKSFYALCNSEVARNEVYEAILDEITPCIELIDYSVVYNFCKNSSKLSLDALIIFLLKNLYNDIHSLRITAVFILKQLTQSFVAEDIEIFEKKSESLEAHVIKYHFLNRFEDYINRYDAQIKKYLNDFSFKLTEIAELKPIDYNEALSYLLLWDCIIYVCANSPVYLRVVYTDWLHENKYEENLLHFLFRAMPSEILKNHDSKLMNTDIFKGLKWFQIKDRGLSLEKYVCHLYTEVLRKLPAMVRRWWSSGPSRQKTFVDKLTTNFISGLICSEELKAINSKKEKHENMQVTVHTSTREVFAVYSIDEARMELVITLAQNYPLGAVKVECGKQIGGRTSSRNFGMQLTFLLSHQNGTIFDGLTMWKNNLDKKFQGVEECYVCYTVIHQDTCQLPKLTCKTCKKKFHGPCLYKWFTTSSKSTCPICRNVF